MSVSLPPVETVGARSASGPLLVVNGASGVGWDELAEIRLPGGARRLGIVLEVRQDLALLQVLEGTSGLDPSSVAIAFSGSPFSIPVGPGWLGRTLNGLGEPLDSGPPVLGDDIRPVNGAPMNPTVRTAPRDPLVTGVSAIDVFTTLVRGQKLPIFSTGGLPHLRLAAQLAAQAGAGDEGVVVVFAGIGLTEADTRAVRNTLEERAGSGQLVMFLNTAADPVFERILTPRLALTVAEHLAFEQGRHVLVVMADMTAYCEAVREVSAERGEIPGRRAYPGYLYSDLASIYERCGRMVGRSGSLTQVPVLTMPAGDITHPVPDLTGYITEGQVVLAGEPHRAGIYPPVDELSSLSRLMRHAAGPGQTREDHLFVAAQLVAAMARARDARQLAELVGEAALTETDRRYLAFSEAVSRRLLDQSPAEARTIEQSLGRAWEALSELPARELAMIPAPLVAAHGRRGRPGDARAG